MVRPKPKLTLGKQSKSTTIRRRKKHQSNAIKVYTSRSSWIRTKDEIFNKVTYRNIYSAKKPSVKKFRKNSPLKPIIPKCRGIFKRHTNSPRYETLVSPSKSPRAKKVRRSLYATESHLEHKHTAEIYDQSLQIFNVEPYNTGCSDTVSQTEAGELVKLVPTENDELTKLVSSETDEFIIGTDKLTKLVPSETNKLITGTVEFINETDELITETDELVKLVPSVMENLSENGHAKEMLNFFRLVNDSKFPLENISFQLWMEVVKWFSCGNTTEMRYSENTKKFWKLGYRLFGGQFLYFMSGYKSRNTVVTNETDKGLYSPCQSKINFAVPGKDILTAFSPYDIDSFEHKTEGRRPGILTDMIQTLAASPSTNSYCLTFDGKKIKRGLTKSSGDVDLLGFERDSTLADRKKQIYDMKEPVEQMMKDYGDRDELLNISTDILESEKKQLVEVLTDQLKTVSLNILTARELRKKKVYAKDKLIERGGGSDWKNGKYVLGNIWRKK